MSKKLSRSCVRGGCGGPSLRCRPPPFYATGHNLSKCPLSAREGIPVHTPLPPLCRFSHSPRARGYRRMGVGGSRQFRPLSAREGIPRNRTYPSTTYPAKIAYKTTTRLFYAVTWPGSPIRLIGAAPGPETRPTPGVEPATAPPSPCCCAWARVPIPAILGESQTWPRWNTMVPTRARRSR